MAWSVDLPADLHGRLYSNVMPLWVALFKDPLLAELLNVGSSGIASRDWAYRCRIHFPVYGLQ